MLKATRDVITAAAYLMVCSAIAVTLYAVNRNEINAVLDDARIRYLAWLDGHERARVAQSIINQINEE